MTKPYTRYIEPKTRNLLWAISAGRCHICNELVYIDALTKKRGNFSQVAHIIGNRLDLESRPKEELPQADCNNIENLMLLCPEHHHLIDYEKPGEFPKERLYKIKAAHEKRIRDLTGINPNRVSVVIKYGANIDTHDAVISTTDAHEALSKAGWYPAKTEPIKLGIKNSLIQDNDPDYWRFQVKELEDQYAMFVKSEIRDDKFSHFSIFALAPIPLLIKLGTLLSDIPQVEIYQLQREPQTWEWIEETQGTEYIVSKPDTSHKTVALVLSLSDRINHVRVYRCLGSEGVSVWEVSIENPDKDFLKSRDQLRLFREEIRRILGGILYQHGDDAVIHIFPAMPISAAIELGRVRQPKADLPFIIYDQNRELGGFIETIKIG